MERPFASLRARGAESRPSGYARKKEAEADPTRVDQPQPRRTTIKDAIRMFLEDEEARGLEHSSRKKSRTLFERQFLPFCEARKFVHIDQILPVDLTEFRSTWNNGDVTTHRKHERMHSFFAFCVANDLRRKNPMDALKKPKTPDVVPTDYFLPKEFRANRRCHRQVRIRRRQRQSASCRQRLRALTLLMRWSGLAILDATSLERERLSKNENGDDQIFLYRAKTGAPVNVVIPNEVGDALQALPNSHPSLLLLVRQWRSAQCSKSISAVLLEALQAGGPARRTHHGLASIEDGKRMTRCILGSNFYSQSLMD